MCTWVTSLPILSFSFSTVQRDSSPDTEFMVLLLDTATSSLAQGQCRYWLVIYHVAIRKETCFIMADAIPCFTRLNLYKQGTNIPIFMLTKVEINHKHIHTHTYKIGENIEDNSDSERQFCNLSK